MIFTIFGAETLYSFTPKNMNNFNNLNCPVQDFICVPPSRERERESKITYSWTKICLFIIDTCGGGGGGGFSM